MYLQQTQLFWGLSQEFVKKVMSVARLVSLQPGDVIFKKDDPANCLYILIKGQVKICPNDDDFDACGGACTGEAFGWDSLVEQDRYRTSAVCMKPTALLKLTRASMNTILSDDPHNAALFFRHLARALGDCLMERCQCKNATTAVCAEMKVTELV